MELHHLVRADRLADFQCESRLACPRRTFENDEPSLAQQRCDGGRIGGWEDPCVHLLQACLPLGLRNSLVAAAVLVEEEIQQVGDYLHGVGIAWTDSRGRIEDARVRLHRGVDRRPTGRDRVRNFRGDVEQIRLDPKPPGVQTRERAQSAPVTRTPKDGGVRTEAVRANPERDYASAVPREPDE